MNNQNLTDSSFDYYIQEVHRYPVLSREEEFALATQYCATGDIRDAHRLVQANLKFVIKVAHSYAGYHMRMVDLIQEGNMGLLCAVKKFNPARGYRFISYAVWWIRAYINNFIMHSWSLVKMGTTQTQRKLFFKLRGDYDNSDTAIQKLAQQYRVETSDIIGMGMRLAARDFSLDIQINDDSDTTRMDWLLAHSASQQMFVDEEMQHIKQEQRYSVRKCVMYLMRRLSDKERYIMEHRLMTDHTQTLQEIGNHFGISRERIRQIEGAVIKKLREALIRAGIASSHAA